MMDNKSVVNVVLLGCKDVWICRWIPASEKNIFRPEDGGSTFL
jgi:hypothetical protein